MNYPELAGKKLLVLGAMQRTCVIVNRARELGIYVIVADYFEDSPAKKIADEALLVDATDVDTLAKYCIENHVDGVITAYVDPLLPACFEITRQAGISCYMTETMIRMATDKVFFKHTCEEYGVPVPKTYAVDAVHYKEQGKQLPFPVFLKPVDASGSRGADVAYSYEDFVKKFEYALTFSKKKEITVEDWLRGTEFILDYILIDGEPYLMSMADRFAASGRSVAVNNCNLMMLPSRHVYQYLETTDPLVKNMFRKMGFQNGVIFLQGYVDGEKVTFYEMGCRLGGTWPYVDEHFTGLNPIDMLVNHTITGSMLPDDQKRNIPISPLFDGKSAIIYFLGVKPGAVISLIKGLNEVRNMPETACVIQYCFEGDKLNMDRQTDILLLAVHLVAPDFDRLQTVVNEVYERIDYLDENGQSILMDVIPVEPLEELYGV